MYRRFREFISFKEHGIKDSIIQIATSPSKKYCMHTAQLVARGNHLNILFNMNCGIHASVNKV